jgi:hypothetical protein
MKDNLTVKKEKSNVMLDTAIGPIVRIIDGNSFQMRVTHIGKHNVYGYGGFETVYIAPKPKAILSTTLSSALVGRRVKCNIRYRDNYNRLFADVEFE